MKVGSIVIFPPEVSGPPWTDVLILLLTSLMESVAWTTILPPLAWLASVVTEAFWLQELRTSVDGDVAGVRRAGAAGGDGTAIIQCRGLNR